MTILILGNFRASYTTENDLAWSLEKLGHIVIRCQEDEHTTEGLLAQCLEASVDLLLYIHTHGWAVQGVMSLDDLWRELDKVDIPTASFHLDYWYGLERQTDVGTHPFWRTKYVFTADGGSDKWYKDQGINHYYLPPGVVERDCYYADPQDRYQHDVIFVGSRFYHKEWPYREQLINWLELTYGPQFALYGQHGAGIVRGEELNRLYRSAKIVVGDSLNLNFNHPLYWSDRVPETLGRGGFLIHPEIEGLKEAYPKLVTYTYGNFEELKEQIDHYINDYAERERLRLANHLHTKAIHSYTNRMQTLLGVIFGAAA